VAENIPDRRTCPICGGVVDRCPIRIEDSKVSKKEARRKLRRPNPFDNYPNQVCASCDSRAVDTEGKSANPGPPRRSQSNPFFIDGIKCWRLYGLDGYAYVAMRDYYDSRNLTDFLDQSGLNRCKVDSLTPDDLDSVTKWLPRLRKTSRAVIPQPPDGVQEDPVAELMCSLSALSEKVMESGSEFDWPEWQPLAQQYVEDGTLLGSASLETCVRLVITHIRKDRFCDGHFRYMVESGHIESLLTRLEAIRKTMTANRRQGNPSRKGPF
jgi:Family of unknown function (DUF6508)